MHVLGDRRVHFESITDVWELFRTIVDQRKRREIDPTLAMLRQAIDELDRGKSGDALTRERLQQLLEFLETMTALYGDLHRLPVAALRSAARTRGRLRKLFAVK